MNESEKAFASESEAAEALLRRILEECRGSGFRAAVVGVFGDEGFHADLIGPANMAIDDSATTITAMTMVDLMTATAVSLNSNIRKVAKELAEAEGSSEGGSA